MFNASQSAHWQHTSIPVLLTGYMLSETGPGLSPNSLVQTVSDNTYHALHGVPMERPGVTAPRHQPPQDSLHTNANRVPRYSPLFKVRRPNTTANYPWRCQQWLPPPPVYLPMNP